MKKIIAIIALLLAFSFVLTGCGEGDKKNETTTAEVTTAAEEQTPAETYDENGHITLTYNGKGVEGDGAVEYEVTSRYTQNKTIEITIPENQHFLAVTIAKGVLPESIVYLKSNKFSYTVPSFSGSYPPELSQKGCIISARIPTVEELKANHNLAQNCCDLLSAKTVFPHAATNNTYTDAPEWMARNIIDSYVQNTAHGTYPYQSWGPSMNVSSKDYIKIDFGHEVSINELVLYIRADFPHDAFWDSCTVEFSDGSTMELSIKGQAKKQPFKFGEPITTSSLKFTKFNKSKNSQGDWAAWVELQVNGSELIG